MRTKSFIVLLFFTFTLLYPALEAIEKDIDDEYIECLGPLVFHLKTCFTPNNAIEDRLNLDVEDVSYLWNKASHILYTQRADHANEAAFESAYQLYENAQHDLLQGDFKAAQKNFKASHQILSKLLSTAIDHQILFLKPLEIHGNQLLRKQTQSDLGNHDFENNSYFSRAIKKKLRPHIIPDSHPMKPVLDSIFKSTRATADENTFAAAGFETIAARPRSHLKVARHPQLPGYLVKAMMDTEKRRKKRKPSWQWLINRCEGANKIAELIKMRKIKYFNVAKKWIYPLPVDPPPPSAEEYVRHLTILLVTDMNLVSEKKNLKAWKKKITKDHLDELYFIISRAKGSSYRADNIWYTKENKFAFIDTEYPTSGPDYESIRRFLNPEMRAYWDRIVKKGGDL